MKCPYCSALDTKVIDSRLNQPGDITRRRRSCPRCEGRFTTYERVEEVMPVVIKKDGRREDYVRQKVLAHLEPSGGLRPPEGSRWASESIPEAIHSHRRDRISPHPDREAHPG